MASLKERIINTLLKHKLLSEAQLREAINRQKEKGGNLQDILISLGFVRTDEILGVISESLQIPPISLSKLKIDSDVVRLLPKGILLHYQIIPISKIGNTLTVAMSDPLNVFAIDEIKTLTNYQIDIVIASKEEIVSAINTYCGESVAELIDSISKDIQQSKLEFVQSVHKEEEVDSARLLSLIEEAPVVQITNIILNKAVSFKASDVLIEPMGNFVRIRYRIDGILRESDSPPPKSMRNAIVSRIKVMSGLNIAERRLPQDGRFKIHIEDRDIDFRISILPSRLGEKVAIRILDKAQVILDIDRLGFEEKGLSILKKSAMRPHGMLLVCGPAGSGKTTTLYSILKYVDSPEKNIVTVEDPVEYQLEGINQVAVKSDLGLTFASALRSILRQDPNVIMIGEIRDRDTVDIAIKSALTGHLVLSTLHTNTAAGSVARLIDMKVEPFLIVSSLISIVAQRLLRKICQSCKEEAKIPEDMLKTIGCNNKQRFYKGKGCKHCMGSGYSGRAAITEVLELDPEIQGLILSSAQEETIKRQARRAGMVTLREDGILKALKGLTTLEEVIRVTAEDEPL